MNELTVKAAVAGFLHDLNKLVDRAGMGKGEGHSELEFLSELIKDKDILEAISNHRKSQLEHTDLDANSIAYIIHIAKLISFGTNYRKAVEEIENDVTDDSIPMATVFNIINSKAREKNKNKKIDHCYRMVPLSENINFPVPQSDYKVSQDDYKNLITALKKDLQSIEFNEKYLDTLASVLEKHLSFVPATTSVNEMHDISMYDHSKVTASISSNICEYLLYNGITSYREELFENMNAFLDKKAFIMYSGDFSGIQSFIYNIVADGALKSLRSRSFFLEMLMEHIIDEILQSCGLSRANLIYSGGGHCYVLLPNTEEVENKVNGIGIRLNEWLREYFGNQLYYAWAYVKCSANDLMNIPAIEKPYEEIYRNLSRGLSRMKLSRYTADELRELNNKEQGEGIRECSICGTESNLSSENRCLWCERFVSISSALLSKDLFITVTDTFTEEYPYLTFPVENGEVYYYLTDEKDCRKLIREGHVRRIYIKNKFHNGLPNSRCLFMGDYVYSTLVEELLDKDEMRRLSVLRADVDDLGQAFIGGFVQKDEDPVRKHMYNTLSRTATFSRQMNMFFKYYLNFILENMDMEEILPGDKGQKPRIVVVYSGGDDLFLVGNFRSLLKASVCINDKFKDYALGTLTLSSGIGVFPLKYPIYKSAEETADLESKSKESADKDSVSVFSVVENHTYNNDIFKNKVIGIKLELLINYFSTLSSNQVIGNALLYRLLNLLKDSDERINIARCAYILSKMEPVTGNKAIKEAYRDFADKMYSWITNPNDRKEIITAIYIYLFLTRKRSE